MGWVNPDSRLKRYLRPKEYAQERSVSERTVKTWMYNRTIPFIKVGRVVLIDPHEADVALQRFKRKPVS